MQSIRQIQRLNDAELEKCVPSNASWHTDYRDTAYVYIGGLPFELSEGDVLTIFSQYGNPVHVNLVRDKETGKSRGFAFLKYEDQRSCDLAVDNLSGAGVLGRTLTVDHTRYKLKEGEVEGQGLEEDGPDEADDTDREGEKRRKRRRTDSIEEPQRPKIKEELELAKLLKDHDDDDPMKAYLIKEKKEQITEALKNLAVDSGEKKERRHKHRSHRHKEDDADEDDRDHHRHRSRDRPRHRDDDRKDDRKARDGRDAPSRKDERSYRRRHPSDERSPSTDSEIERRRRRRRDDENQPDARSSLRARSKDRQHGARDRDTSTEDRATRRRDDYRRH